MGSQQQTPILLVTPDFAGPTRGGGIGTAFYYLAAFLRDEGYDVHVLYCLPDWTDGDASLEEWKKTLKEQGLTLHCLSKRSAERAQLQTSWHVKTAWDVADLADSLHRKHRFAAIHMPEWGGFGYFIVRAKREQNAFADTELIVQTHSPTSWHRHYNQEPMNSLALVQIDLMERYAVEQADILISPSHYMLDWLQTAGWQLAETRQVIPNLYKSQQQSDRLAGHDIAEIVFFGRLEIRKGVNLFLDSAVNINHNRYKITFIGKDSEIKGKKSSDYIVKQAKLLGLTVDIVTDYDQQQAVAYLKQPGRLTVIASLQENLPYVAYECLAEAIPCLISDAGGMAELVAEESRDILFAPEVAALTQRLNQTVKQKTRLGKLSFLQDNIRTAWRELHASLAAPSQGTSPAEIDISALYASSPVSWGRRADSLKQTLYADALLAGLIEERYAFVDQMHSQSVFSEREHQDDLRQYAHWVHVEIDWMQDAIKKYEENIDDMNKYISSLEKENNALLKKNHELDEQLEAVLNSTIWRLSKPLRALFAAFRKRS